MNQIDNSPSDKPSGSAYEDLERSDRMARHGENIYLRDHWSEYFD